MASSHTVSVTIAAPPDRVYRYASDPRHLPAWAPGFVNAIEERHGQWVAATSLGDVVFRFAPENPFGILDPIVVLPTGEAFKNPMRVVSNEAGSEVLFTLFQVPPMSDDQFADDTQTVLADLTTLKALIESGG